MHNSLRLCSQGQGQGAKILEAGAANNARKSETPTLQCAMGQFPPESCSDCRRYQSRFTMMAGL